MRFLKRVLGGIGAIALASMLIMAIAPKTLHAVAAALVQVTNTASAPAVTESVAESAQQIVRIHCVAVSCQAVQSDGRVFTTTTYTYTVPATETLVINAIDLANYQYSTQFNVPTAPCSASTSEQLQVTDANNETYHRENWLLSGGLSHLVYPSGVLFAGGTTLQGITTVNFGCEQSADLYGYLTSN